MGEARCRKLLSKVAGTTAGWTLSDERKRIAAEITGTSIYTVDGGCCYYNILGKLVLAEHGIKTQLVRGGMVYRVGPGQWDGVFYCGPDNKAAGGMHHFWLETDDGLIIDFSSGRWKADTDNDPVSEPLGLPPVNWQVEPPAYIRDQRERVVDPRVAYLPRIGKAFYNGAEVIGDNWEGYAEFRQTADLLLPGIRERLVQRSAA
jgi:hypothetical protein